MTQFLWRILGPKERLWFLAAIVVVLLAGLVAMIMADLTLRQLMKAPADEAVGNAELMRFASKHGGPLFHDHCASCHRENGSGDRVMGVPDLRDKDWLYGTGRVSDIEKVVYYGIRAHNPRGWNLAVMPAYARPVPSATEQIPPMSPEAVRAVIVYLMKLEGRPADGTLALAGDKIYHGSGGCYDCHTDDAKGDSAIGAPNLTDAIWLYGDSSPASLFESIAYGRHGVCPAWEGKLSPSEIREISLFVYSLSHSQK